MTRNICHIILFALTILLAPGISHAQKNIDNIIDKLKKDPKCETTFFYEKRDPQTHKIATKSIEMDIRDTALAKRIIDAFQKDRDKSTRYYQQSRPNDSNSYTIEFRSPDGNSSTYILRQTHRHEKNSRKDVWNLVVKKVDISSNKKTTPKGKKDSSYTITPEDFDISIDYMVIEPYISNHH